MNAAFVMILLLAVVGIAVLFLALQVMRKR